METPLLRQQAAPSSPTQGEGTRLNFPDHSHLKADPSIAVASFGNPRLLAAAQAALGRKAQIMQFGALLTKPGDLGTAGTPENPGAGTHYDYRPQRVVGSSFHFCFAIVPFTDYIDEAGPIALSPSSYKKSTIQPSDGRVHAVEAAHVPAARYVELVNPCLKRGDLALMHCFCWHHAMPMHPAFKGLRHGLYMKLRAADAPPAVGPLLIPTVAHEALPAAQRHAAPYHRESGSQTIEHTAVVLEDGVGRILVLTADDTLSLPNCSTGQEPHDALESWSQDWDASNVISEATDCIEALLGLRPPWMSWIADHKTTDGGEAICRVYGHKLLDGEEVPELPPNAMWIPPAAVEQSQREAWERGGREKDEIKMWLNEQDEAGEPVRRGYGVASGEVSWKRSASLTHLTPVRRLFRRAISSATTTKGRGATRRGISCLATGRRASRSQTRRRRAGRARLRTTCRSPTRPCCPSSVLVRCRESPVRARSCLNEG